jgi:hypothetical protein
MLHFGQLLYIDPGTGSLLFQFLISAFLTVLIFFKKLGMLIRYFFYQVKNLRNKQKSES